MKQYVGNIVNAFSYEQKYNYILPGALATFVFQGDYFNSRRIADVDDSKVNWFWLDVDAFVQ